MTARIRLLAALASVGLEPCGDNSCMFGPPGGMATNGGCRCLERVLAWRPEPEVRAYIRKLAQAMRALAAEVAP